METKKKTWTRPKLVILSRGTPEESVLAACKTAALIAIGPSANKVCTQTSGQGCETAFNS